MADYSTAAHAGPRKTAQKGGRWGITTWSPGVWSLPGGGYKQVRTRRTYDRGRGGWVPHPNGVAGDLVYRVTRVAGFRRTGVTFMPDSWRPRSRWGR